MFRTLCLALCFVMALATAAFSKERVVVVAHDSTWPPMEFMDENQKIVGYSVDYIDAVAAEAGFKVEHKSVAWDGIFAGLAGKKYDLISSSVSITPERAKVLDFSEPYYNVRQAVLVPVDSTALTLVDLSGKQVGAQIGTTGFMALKKTPGIIAKTYDEIGLAVAALAAGKIDAVICDNPVAVNYVLTNKDYASKMKEGFIVPVDTPESYGFVMRKGDTELVELVNRGIEAVKAKGIEAQLRKKWMNE